VNDRGFYRRPPEASPPLLALRPREAARALGVSESTLDRLTRSGEIPVVTAGRCRLYELDVLKAWLSSRRTTAAEGGRS
jgi:excisionase family DNA binding protein